ncbi:MAG: Hpt domain-containing protein [Bacteroidales bacterium]|jgi:HPt (histidine-containing phosphotransfer) domain-containing protein
METQNPKPYNLSKLSGFLGDDPQQVVEMIGLFLETIPPELVLLKEYASSGCFEEVATIAHRIKPSLDVFDLQQAMKVIRVLELFSKDEAHQREVPALVEELTAILKQALKIMETELNR